MHSIGLNRDNHEIDCLVKIEDVSKSYGTNEVLKNISLEVNSGDFLSIIGPSGCGKSTVFNIIAGITNQNSGRIIYNGVERENLSGTVGYMMQKDLLLPWRTILDNVIIGLEIKGTPKAEAKELAREYLSTYGLSGVEDKYPRSLSGGMRQRAALIRTLICDTEILLLDEPFSALDYQTRLYLEGVLIEAVSTFNKTVILVTHDIDEAVALSKKVVVLSHRPTVVKSCYDISLSYSDPLAARTDPRFSEYFKLLCSELDIQTGDKRK